MEQGRTRDASDRPQSLRHILAAKDNDTRGPEAFTVRPPVVPRRHTADPTVPSRRNAITSKTPPFSCRRWRKLTGKGPEDGDKVVASVAHPPAPHWAAASPSGFISTFPTTAPVPAHKPLPSKWQAIDRFDGRVMKTLVDRAYGITPARHTVQQFPLHHGNRAAQQQFIHTQVYLPSVHRTLDYLSKTRDLHVPKPVQRPAPIGSQLLSTQLEALQADLMAHYDAEKAVSTPSDSVWSPRPPQSQTSTDSPAGLLSSTSSFRSHRRSHPKIVRSDEEAKEEEEEEEEENATSAESERVMVLTDSDTYSLSSGVTADSEMEEPTPPVDVSLSSETGSASWSSLESHVLLALEGSQAALIGSVREPLVVVYDSDELARSSGSNSEPEASLQSHASAGAVGDQATNEDEPEHVVFVDNSVRVNAAGQAISVEIELVDTWAVLECETDETCEPLSSDQEPTCDGTSSAASESEQGEQVDNIYRAERLAPTEDEITLEDTIVGERIDITPQQESSANVPAQDAMTEVSTASDETTQVDSNDNAHAVAPSIDHRDSVSSAATYGDDADFEEVGVDGYESFDDKISLDDNHN